MSDTEIKKLNRREFLAYMMAGSIGLLGIQATGIALWYATPDYYDENTYILKTVPRELYRSVPANIISDTPQGRFRFWLSYSAKGLVAFHKECPFRSTLYAWVNNYGQFVCPACGSKYERDGTYVEGPASHDLNRYALKIITQNRIYDSDEAGNPIPVSLNSIEEIQVIVGKLIQGSPREMNPI